MHQTASAPRDPRWRSARDLKAHDLVALRVGSRPGFVVALADDAPVALVRWDGGRICDWVKVEELKLIERGTDEPNPPKGE